MVPLLGIAAFQVWVQELSTLDLSPMTNGWGRPQIDKSISGKPLTLGGTRFEKGVGAHANARINLTIENALSFSATVGVDDAAGGEGSVEFLVEVDGKVVWKSGVMRIGDPPKRAGADLRGAKTLALRVTDAGDGQSYDHADWAEPTLSLGVGGSVKVVRDLRPLRIATVNAAMNLYVDDENRLMQRAFGAKDTPETPGQLAYPAAGDGWIFEPALQVRHADGNTSTDLRVVKTSTTGDLTRVEMKDPEYPFFVDLFFRTYPNEDVIEAWTEVRHTERGPVTLDKFASSAPDFGTGEHWLTQFHGNWAAEANVAEEKLSFGTKTLDTKLGVRAHQFLAPWFILAKGGPAKEDSGEVFGGSLAWSGNFAFDFEVDPMGRLRATTGVSPYASAYRLKPGERFATPKMVWAWSGHGKGELSRKLHRWTRKNVLRDGDQPRAILLNNWEATYFDFDEKKIVSLFDGAKSLGMELFLLDDGWFGKKYPRDGDTQGLGDWIPDPKKLPNGIRPLTTAAKERGLRFGIWVEPEMVNPKSELFEKHPDWAIQQPKRPLDLQRNQLVLDMTNPKVKEFAFQSVDKMLRENPGISYIKWDCNRYLTQPGSPFLGPDGQSNLWVDYVRALYDVFDRLAKAHPHVEIMMCSGGGGRVDYGAMAYAHELWPSDMTDPARRIFIQWGYSHFFPPISVSNHVTLAGDHGMKFAFDVAMSGRLGMDVDVDKLSPAQRADAARAIAAYKDVRPLVHLGDQYRLESPYDGPRSALMNVGGDRAVVFVYALKDTPAASLKLKGLDPAKRYSVREINLPEGAPGLAGTFEGRALLDEGLALPAYKPFNSGVFELRAQ
ncbi:melibiase [bacterium]|nr:MAG: melibiase [bacterium]